MDALQTPGGVDGCVTVITQLTWPVLAVLAAESVTMAVKLIVPGVDGSVPEMTPVLVFNVRGLTLPPVIAYGPYGGTPPAAIKLPLYGAPTAPVVVAGQARVSAGGGVNV